MLSGDIYTRQMLERHHRAALSRATPVPSWQLRESALRSSSARSRRRRLRVFVVRLRTAHTGA
jgi:hypothetical protein